MGNATTSFSQTAVESLDLTERGLRLEALQQIHTDFKEKRITFAKDQKDLSPGERLVYGFVKPATEEKKWSYASQLYHDPSTRELVGKCTTFVSHPWFTDFHVTLEAICEYEKSLPRNYPTQFYFVDYFAVNQHMPTDDLDQLGDLVESCSTLALMAEPWDKPVALTRL